MIPTWFLDNPVGLSILPVGEWFFIKKLLFSYGILILKGKNTTCQVKHTKNKSGYYNILSKQCLSVGLRLNFPETAS